MTAKQATTPLTPFPESPLIWICRKDQRQNHFLIFRRFFSLSRLPDLARLRISAYAHYQVALNGTPLGRGPDPSNPNRYYFDAYDCRNALRTGRNVLSVLAYAFGPELPWPETAYLSGEFGWLGFALECVSAGGNRRVIGSGADCQVRTANAWARHSPGFTELRAAYKEYYDARKIGYESWLSASAESEGWKPATVLRKDDLTYDYTFVPKEIPPFRHRPIHPREAYSIDGGYAYGFSRKRGWQIENPEALVKDYPLNDYYHVIRWGEPNFKDQRMQTADNTACVVNKFPRCGVPALWMDFGGIQYGSFEMEIETPVAGSVIDVGYGESPNITFVDRYTSRAGRQTFRPYHARAGRYVMISFKTLRGPIKVHGVRFLRCDYPTPDPDEAMVTDSNTINRIHSVAANTLQLCMHSHFEDCPWREQKLYVGDMLLEALAAYYLWGAYDYVRKNLRQLAERRRSDGWVTSGPGVARGSGLIVDFPLYYIIELRDYTLHAGDQAFLAGMYPHALRLLENYRKLGWSRDGLLDVGEADTFSNWCFINWNDIVKKGHCAPLNFLLARALEASQQMAEWLDKRDDARRIGCERDALRDAVNHAFWDAKHGLYCDSRYRGRPIPHFSTETNILALLSGIPDNKQSEAILSALLSGKLCQTTPTPFFTALVAEALFRHRQGDAALQLIESYWGGMLQRGTDAFWEVFLPQTPLDAMPPKWASLCHGWGSAPAYLLPAYVLGIRPLEPGFRQFTVDPQPGKLRRLCGSVPTPYGPIRIDFQNGRPTVTHPPETRNVTGRRMRSK